MLTQMVKYITVLVLVQAVSYVRQQWPKTGQQAPITDYNQYLQ